MFNLLIDTGASHLNVLLIAAGDCAYFHRLLNCTCGVSAQYKSMIFALCPAFLKYSSS